MEDSDGTGTRHEGFHHMTLNVQDVARSERWYAEVLGFQRMAGYETAVTFRDPDGLQLEVFAPGAPVPAEG